MTFTHYLLKGIEVVPEAVKIFNDSTLLGNNVFLSMLYTNDSVHIPFFHFQSKLMWDIL